MRVVLADLKSSRGFVSKEPWSAATDRARSVFARDPRGVYQEAVSRRPERAHGVHRRDPGARRPRGEVDAWRNDGRRRRARPVVARRSQERDGVGRRDARARREGRVHRHHGVEDAASCSWTTAISSSTASPRPASCAWRRASIPSGIRVSEQIDDLDSLPFPRWDLVTEIAARRLGIQWSRVRSAAGIRCSRAAAARSSAPTVRTAFSPAIARARSRTSSTRSSGCAIRSARPYVIFRDPLFTEQRERCSSCATRSSARGLHADVRVRDAARSAGRRAARHGCTPRASAR